LARTTSKPPATMSRSSDFSSQPHEDGLAIPRATESSFSCHLQRNDNSNWEVSFPPIAPVRTVLIHTDPESDWLAASGGRTVQNRRIRRGVACPATADVVRCSSPDPAFGAVSVSLLRQQISSARTTLTTTTLVMRSSYTPGYAGAALHDAIITSRSSGACSATTAATSAMATSAASRAARARRPPPSPDGDQCDENKTSPAQAIGFHSLSEPRVTRAQGCAPAPG